MYAVGLHVVFYITVLVSSSLPSYGETCVDPTHMITYNDLIYTGYLVYIVQASSSLQLCTYMEAYIVQSSSFISVTVMLEIDIYSFEFVRSAIWYKNEENEEKKVSHINKNWKQKKNLEKC